jgi:hypothetical protein
VIENWHEGILRRSQTAALTGILVVVPLPPLPLVKVDIAQHRAPLGYRDEAVARWQRVVAYEPKTELGRRLWEIRKRIIASGEPLLGWDELEKEVAERKGAGERGEG